MCIKSLLDYLLLCPCEQWHVLLSVFICMEFSQLQVCYCFLPFLRFWALYDFCSAGSSAGTGFAGPLRREASLPRRRVPSWQDGVNAGCLGPPLTSIPSSTATGFSHYLGYSLLPYTLNDQTLVLLKMRLGSGWWLVFPSSPTHPVAGKFV